MVKDTSQNASPSEAGFIEEKELLAPSVPNETPLPKAEQLSLALQTSSKVPKRKQVHPLRKRRCAEKIAPSCPI
jgi:hypothetical protein